MLAVDRVFHHAQRRAQPVDARLLLLRLLQRLGARLLGGLLLQPVAPADLPAQERGQPLLQFVLGGG